MVIEIFPCINYQSLIHLNWLAQICFLGKVVSLTHEQTDGQNHPVQHRYIDDGER